MSLHNLIVSDIIGYVTVEFYSTHDTEGLDPCWDLSLIFWDSEFIWTLKIEFELIEIWQFNI